MIVGIMGFLFLFFLFIGFPVAYSMGLAAVLALIIEGQIPIVLLSQQFYTALDNFSLLAVPLFILAGELMNVGGITERLVSFTRSLLGHIRGGLAHANIVTNMFMAAISGSAAADAAAIGSIMIPAMKRDGYRPEFAVAVTSSAALMGPIIPPSIVAVLYGSITNVSIGRLLLAGATPGIIAGFGMMIVAYFISKNEAVTVLPRAKFNVVLKSALNVFPAALMPLIILGGIISGVFTPTEAAGVAALYGLVFGIVTGKFNKENLYEIFLNAAKTTSAALITLAGAALFGWVLARAGTAQFVIQFLTSITNTPQIILLIIITFLIILGGVVETIPAMMLSVPVLSPIALKFGFDPVHFGCLVMMSVVLGAVMPPTGIVAMICCRIGNVSFSSVMKTIYPFILWWFALIAMVAIFPEIALWLPNYFN
jgi:C4-dicarboxylate transporter, DctM subunit